jgi:trigger factor
MEIELPDYKKIASQIRKRKLQVSEEEVEDALIWLQKSRAKFSLKDSPSQKGDWIEIEYWSSQIDNGFKIKDAFILGQGKFIPGFEENLENLKSGQEKEFQLTFPENHYRKDLVGKRFDFHVKINSVQKVELPEINDQFAQNLGRFQNLEALKKSIKEGISLEKEERESQRVRMAILEKIAQDTEIKIPEILVEEEKKRMLEDLKTKIPQLLQISFEDYLVKINKTEKEVLDGFSAEAEKRIKKLLILKEIGKRERIEVSKEEIEEEINKILKNYSSVEEAEKELDLEELKMYIEDRIRNEKTLQFLEGLTQKT